MLRKLARLKLLADHNRRLVVAVLCVSAILSFGPWVVLHLGHLWRRQHYQFFPMLIVAIVGLAVSRRASVPPLTSGNESTTIRWKIHLPLFVLMIVSLSGACWLHSPWFGMVACFLFLSLLARNLGDLHPVVLPLLLLIPLPFATDTNLIMRLQSVSSTGASALLDMAGVRHVMAGNVLELADRKFFVEEACSGIGSAFLMLATAGIYCVWKRLRTIIVLPLLVSSVIWAVAGNTFRIFVVAFSHAMHGPDLSHGLLHELLGIATYCLSIGLLLLTEQSLQFLFAPIYQPLSDGTLMIKYGDSVRRSLIQFWNRQTSVEEEFLTKRAGSGSIVGISMRPLVFMGTMIPVLVLFSVVNGLLFFPSVFADSWSSRLPAEIPIASQLTGLPVELFSKSTSAPQLLDCRTVSRTAIEDREVLGAHSRIWTLKISGAEVIASIDGPFEQWHDVRQSYLDDGWKILKHDSAPSPGIGDGVSVVSRTELYRGNKERSLLLFGEFSANGVPVKSPVDFAVHGIAAGLQNRTAATSKAQSPGIWQFQMLLPHTEELDSTTCGFWTQAYAEFFKDVLDGWSRQP